MEKVMPTPKQASQWYSLTDPVHGFDHVLRVLGLAEMIGEALGADLAILRAAALLHDAEGADPTNEGEGANRATHQLASADFARQVLSDEGWEEDRIKAVEHCIRSHRYRGEEAPESLEARVLFDADKLDVLGAFGIARTIGYAVQAGQPVYAPVSARFEETGETEADEPHSAYHEYRYKLRRVADRLHTRQAQKIAKDRVGLLDDYFQQLKSEVLGSPEGGQAQP